MFWKTRARIFHLSLSSAAKGNYSDAKIAVGQQGLHCYERVLLSCETFSFGHRATHIELTTGLGEEFPLQHTARIYYKKSLKIAVL